MTSEDEELPQHEPSTEQWRAVIEQIEDILQGLSKASASGRRVRNLHVLHGIAFYTSDTAKAALSLIDQGMSTSAAILTRVVLEHGVVAQWLALTDSGIDDFIHQSRFQSQGMVKTARLAGVNLSTDVDDAYRAAEKIKGVPDLAVVRNTFKAVDPDGGLYLQYKHLCGYVHPSGGTTARYMHTSGERQGDLRQRPDEVPERMLIFTLALGVSLAASPYLDLFRGKPYKRRLRDLTEPAQIPIWLTEDGQPPRK